MASRRQVQNQKHFFNENQISWAAVDASKEGPSIFSQIGVIFLLLFFVTVAIYSVKTEVPVIVEGIGKITSTSPPVPIRSSATFTVDQVLVKENDKVVKGQILANSAENLKPAELVKLKSLLSGLARINALPDSDLCLRCSSQLGALSQIYLTIRAQGEMLDLISPLNDQIRQFSQVVDQYNDIEKGLVAVRLQNKNSERKLQEIRKRRAEKVLAKEVEELEGVIISNKTQISEKFRGAAMQIREVRRTLKARTKEINERIEQFGKSYVVTSPFAGKIINLKLKGTGELVTGGQVLMEVIPADSPLMASVDIQNKDISSVKAGDEVIISVDSLPELDYGTMTGRVKEIIQVEADTQNPQASNNNFRVHVTLPASEMSKGTLSKPLLLGMTLRGRVVTRFESLAKSIYRVLFKVKDDIQVSQ